MCHELRLGAQQFKVIVGAIEIELAGLAGKVTIKIENKKHFYDFEYTLPEKP